MGSASMWIQTLFVTTDLRDIKCVMISFCDGHQSSFGSIASGIARASMLGKCSYYFSTFINHLQVLVPTFCSNFLSNFFFLFSPPLLFWVSKKLPLPWVAMEKIHQAMSLRVDNSFAVSLARSQVAATHAAAELQLPRGVPWRRPKEALDGKKLIQIPAFGEVKTMSYWYSIIDNRADTYLLDVWYILIYRYYGRCVLNYVCVAEK